MEFKSVDLFDSNGRRLPGAQAYVYEAGTTTGVTVYDEDGVVMAQPITSDAQGRVAFMAANGVYDVSVTYGGQTLVAENITFDDPSGDIARIDALETSVAALPDDSDLAAIEAAFADADASLAASLAAVDSAYQVADAALDGRVSDLEALGGAGAQYTSGGPVACATTANITLSGEQTIDGVTTSASRVLVKSQSTASANGIYVTGAGAWSRATDMDAADEVAGTAVFVSGGTVNGLKSYATYSEVTTLGTDAITFVEIANNSGIAATLAQKAPLAAPALTGAATLDGEALATKAYADSVAAVERQTLGEADDFSVATAYATNSSLSYIFEHPSEKDGTIATLAIKATTAGAVDIRLYDRDDGQTFSVASEQSVTVAVGYQTIAISMAVKAGQYLGFRNDGGVVGYATTGNTEPVFTVAGDAGSDKTTSATQRILLSADIIQPATTSDSNALILPYERNHIDMAGQSNAEGRGTAQTTAQVYDALGYVDSTLNPANSVALTSGNIYTSTQYETPGFAVSQVLREAAMELDGMSPGGPRGGPVVMGLNADGSKQLFEFVYYPRRDGGTAGGAYFQKALSQIARTRLDAASAGVTSGAVARFFFQGEQDAYTGASRVTNETGTVRETYAADLSNMVADWDLQSRYVGQTTRVVPTVYPQINTYEALDGWSIAMAQLDAALADYRAVLACPTYFLEFSDTVHLTGDAARLCGAYMAWAYADWVKDGGFDPLRGVQASVSGNTITLRMNKSGLVLDTTTIPLQTNYGFEVDDSGASPVTISSVTVDANVVTIVCASSPSGGTLRYGTAQTGLGTYNGYAGNLRGTGTRTFEGSTLHPWSVLFEAAL